MKCTPKSLVIALAAALPIMSAHAQSPADLLLQIQQLQAQLKALQAQVQELSAKPAVDATEFNRVVQTLEVKEEAAKKSGFSDMAVKGVIEASYQNDKNGTHGFSAGSGYLYNDGFGMLEITKQAEGGDGINWTLRLIPGAASLVHEASVSVPLGDASAPRVIAGLIPDWSGYEYSFSHQNPLVSHNLLFTHAAASSYAGVGLQYTKGAVAYKAMLANIDTRLSTDRGAPGLAYNAYWTINEFSYLNFSGAHSRQMDTVVGTAPFDLMEVDGGYTRGDLTLNGQLSWGKVKNGASNGDDAKWWGVSGLAGYKLTPRLQALARYDFINNRSNGGGMYYDPTSGVMFGAELDETGAIIDPNVGTTRSALSLGLNYAVNPSTQLKTELRFDRSSGYNFVERDGLTPTKSNTTLGAAVVVSF